MSLKINNRSYIAFNNRGVSNFKLKNYRIALEDFNRSFEMRNPMCGDEVKVRIKLVLSLIHI